MDKDRVGGSAQQVKGAVKEAVGEVRATPICSQRAKLTRLKGKCKTPSAA
jgi:uncharacterized protein YjbJ (UPF0337 family)